MYNKVHNADCMEFMKDCKDNQFDLAVVDPPYGIVDKTSSGGENHMAVPLKRNGLLKWDTAPPASYFQELKRVSKNQIIWGGNYFVQELDHSRGWIVWDKKHPPGFTRAKAELAYTSFNRNLEIFYFQICGEIDKGKIHPTQKPIPLYKWILENYASPGDKIFDSHLGSGSSRIAAYELGYDFEGCELDTDYWEAQEKRFEEFKKKFHNEFYIPDEENLLFPSKKEQR